MADNWIDKGDFNIPTPTLRDVDNNHPLPDPRGLFVLHAVLLRTGKVLMFCGHVEGAHYAKLSYVWNPDIPDLEMVPIPFPGGVDLFCCHYVQLYDGKILVVGGSIDFHAHANNPDRPDGGSYGKKSISIFDPDTETWSLSKDGSDINEMDHGRWYPTSVAMGDGTVAVFSGRREDSTAPDSVSDKVELIIGKGINYKAREVGGFNNATFKLPIYPGMVLAPDGKIFYIGSNWGQEFSPNPKTRSLLIDHSNPGSPTGTWDTYANAVAPTSNRREEGTYVLLPPAKDGKIMVVGGTLAVNSGVAPRVPIAQAGGPSAFHSIFDANDPFSAQTLDTKTNPPSWDDAGTNEAAQTGRTNGGRTNGHCVILPDSTVLLLGGSDGYRWNGLADATNPTLQCEIFDGTNFTKVASLNHPRRYHSIALLLPDGSVLAAGGADPDQTEPTLTYPVGWNAPTVGPGNVLNRRDYEIYQPSYFVPGRPTITKIMQNDVLVASIKHGSTFEIYTPQGNDITKAALMKPGAPTHHTDTEQRYIALEIKSKSADKIQVEVTNNHNLAPPGYYMVWILKGNLPCQKAFFIRLYHDSIITDAGGCVIATAVTGSILSPEVLYLRNLRNEIKESSTIGKNFIKSVNKLYYSFSPGMARVIGKNEKARTITNRLVVQPTWKIIKNSHRLIFRYVPKPLAYGILIMALCIESILALIFLPILCVITFIFSLTTSNRKDG